MSMIDENKLKELKQFAIDGKKRGLKCLDTAISHNDREQMMFHDGVVSACKDFIHKINYLINKEQSTVESSELLPKHYLQITSDKIKYSFIQFIFDNKKSLGINNSNGYMASEYYTGCSSIDEKVRLYLDNPIFNHVVNQFVGMTMNEITKDFNTRPVSKDTVSDDYVLSVTYTNPEIRKKLDTVSDWVSVSGEGDLPTHDNPVEVFRNNAYQDGVCIQDCIGTDYVDCCVETGVRYFASDIVDGDGSYDDYSRITHYREITVPTPPTK